MDKDSNYNSSTQNLQNNNIDMLFDSWKNDFFNLSVSEQQTALYNMLCDYVYWRIIYYMRRFPERLVSSRQTYSDRCIGFEELNSYMGYIEENGYAMKWLQDNHVPSLDEVRTHAQLLETQLHVLLELDTPCPILRFKKHFNLSLNEMYIISILVIIMSAENLLRLMAVAWADFSIRQPTVSFLCQMMSDTKVGFDNVCKAFAEHGTLRRMRLIITENDATMRDTPLMYAPIVVEQAVIDAFLGRNNVRELPPHVTLHKDHLPLRSLVVDASVQDELSYVLKSPTARCCLVGPAHSGRRTVLSTFASKAKYSGVLEVEMSSVFDPRQPTRFEEQLSNFMREALFEGSLLLLRFDGIDNKIELVQHITKSQIVLAKLASNYPGTIVLLVNKVNAALSDAFGNPQCISILLPNEEIAAGIWKRALAPWTSPDDADHMAKVFSRNYSLPIGSIFTVVQNAVDALQVVSSDVPALQSHHILNEIRKTFRHQLGSLAEITVSDVPLAGVVLPADAKAQVREILDYAINLHNVLDEWGFKQRSPYGNALSVLFAGPPGTGKTLLACALANELGKVLYRVDLSRIVDKYIGETEKNLGKIFDEASKAQAIILFDEADSLFAKRTEVKSSNDRYANLEINFLLQKLESYNGITILTTNLSKSIDEAFRRRLRFIIDFPMPDVQARIELWKRMMPPNAPLADDINWSWLARTFEMSGGYIRNAVLKAAITASAAKKPISMEHLAKAASAEARSMGILLRIDDYDDYED